MIKAKAHETTSEFIRGRPELADTNRPMHKVEMTAIYGLVKANSEIFKIPENTITAALQAELRRSSGLTHLAYMQGSHFEPAMRFLVDFKGLN